ncbi:hypothetical protein B0H13DRAFT_1871661 [Mycena leptocephala]|nr:hypothetical protein B0H13DRAFT_1871661 [Mycena leptocephala]
MAMEVHLPRHPVFLVLRGSALARILLTSNTSSKLMLSIGPEEEEPIAPFPDGGLRAWATVFGAFLIQLYTQLRSVFIKVDLFPISKTDITSPSDFYVRDCLSHPSSSAISDVALRSTGHISIPGVESQSFSRLLFYGGCFIQSFSISILSLCQRQKLCQMFLAQGVGMGLGAGIVYIPSMAIVSYYFQKRRALAMSIVASGSSFGAIIHPIMLNNTLHRSLGFEDAVRASAGLVTGLLLLACLLMCPRLPPPQSSPEFWKSLGCFIDDKPYVLATLGLALFSIAFYFALFVLQLDAMTHGIDHTFSFYALVILSASSFVGRIVPGFFANSREASLLPIIFCESSSVRLMLNIMWHVQPFPSTTTTIIANESAGSPATRADIQYRAFITVAGGGGLIPHGKATSPQRNT